MINRREIQKLKKVQGERIKIESFNSISGGVQISIFRLKDFNLVKNSNNNKEYLVFLRDNYFGRDFVYSDYNKIFTIENAETGEKLWSFDHPKNCLSFSKDAWQSGECVWKIEQCTTSASRSGENR